MIRCRLTQVVRFFYSTQNKIKPVNEEKKKSKVFTPYANTHRKSREIQTEKDRHKLVRKHNRNSNLMKKMELKQKRKKEQLFKR